MTLIERHLKKWREHCDLANACQEQAFAFPMFDPQGDVFARRAEAHDREACKHYWKHARETAKIVHADLKRKRG